MPAFFMVADEPTLMVQGRPVGAAPGQFQLMSLTDANAGAAAARVLMRATTKTVIRRRIWGTSYSLGGLTPQLCVGPVFGVSQVFDR